ncbi:hypothetical protein GDO81_018338 [Engystomops pustulosus]|uniref:Uncharacterized protein n=1 Tax=Engystomops pustulosus TaxID=76066 RepID=A0AAV7AAH6_ENGPU|nr:hypothetical protein GDO81_018338 [Engystomops pustulosus]
MGSSVQHESKKGQKEVVQGKKIKKKVKLKKHVTALYESGGYNRTHWGHRKVQPYRNYLQSMLCPFIDLSSKSKWFGKLINRILKSRPLMSEKLQGWTKSKPFSFKKFQKLSQERELSLFSLAVCT